MTWLVNNWIWIVFAFGMFAMHFFGHRHGHGSAHGNGHDPDPAVPADRLSRQTEGEVSGALGPAALPHASLADDANVARRSSVVPQIALHMMVRRGRPEIGGIATIVELSARPAPWRASPTRTTFA